MNTNALAERYRRHIAALAEEWFSYGGTCDGFQSYLLELAPHPPNLAKVWTAEALIAVNAIAPDPAPTLGTIPYAPNADGQLTLLL